eukprot:g4688.t1
MLIRDDHCDLAGEGLHEVVFTYVELFLPSLGECWLVAPPHDFATPRGETEVVSPWQSGGFGKLPEPRLRKRWALWFALFPRLSWVVSVDSLPSLLLELESGNTWWHDFPFWLCLARVVALVGLYGKDTKATDWKTKNQPGLKTARADRYDLPLRVLRGLTSCFTQVRKKFFAETAASAGKVPSTTS